MANRFDKIFSEKLSAVIAITSLICLLVSIYIFIIHGSWQFSPILDEAKVAQFGDFVGGVVGTLLAFVAAILYYVALKEQRKDIAINQKSMNLQNEALAKQIEEFEKQKEELALTRIVYEQQCKTMKEQEHTMKIQQFESSFYSFLNVYIAIKNELNTNDEEKDFFKTIFFKLCEYIDIEHSSAYWADNYWCALTDGKIKYIWFFRTGEEQLFDLSKDPYELHDLSKAKASGKTLEKMRKAMAGHLQERGEEWVKDGKLVIRNKNLLYSPNYPTNKK